MRKRYFLNFQAKAVLPIMLVSSLFSALPGTGMAQKKSTDEHRISTSLVRQQQSKTAALAVAEGSENLRTAAATISKPGTEMVYSPNGSGWTHEATITYTYDAMGRVTDQVERGRDGVNSRRSLTTYDARGNETEELYYNWTGSRWEISYGYQSIYTYNANGRITEVLEKVMENGTWMTDRKRTYTYNASGAILTEESQRWDGISWLVRWRDIYSYTSSSTAPSGVTFLYANDTTGVLENDERIIDIVWRSTSLNSSTGFPEGEPISYTYQSWRNGVWVNDEKYTTTYDQNGNFVQIEQKWQNNAWVNYGRSIVNFDAKGNGTLWEYQQWENGAWVIEDGSKNIYTYNASGQMTEEIYQSWNEETRMYENRHRSVYSNFQTITAAPEEALALLTEVYPNPTNGTLTLQMAQTTSPTTVKVTDVTGKTLYTHQLAPATRHLQIDLATLPAGLYMLQLNSADTKAIRKIVKH